MIRAGVCVVAWVVTGVGSGGGDDAVVGRCGTPESGALVEPKGLVYAVEPKPLGEATQKGLAWLVERQREDGGWNQGEGGSRRGEGGGGRQGEEVERRSNVADTCMAALALVRSGSTPTSGPHARAVARAVDFVCGKIEASDESSLWVTDVRGTRVQAKIGTYVDTFLASMLLSEVSHAAQGTRVETALAKVLAKIERNQREDGGFDQEGWAPVLSQSLAGKALGRAAQRGFDVDFEALAASDGYFVAAGELGQAASPGAAGILLYDGAAKLGALQESALSAAGRERELKDRLAKAESDEARAELTAALDGIESGRRAQAAVQDAVIERLERPDFVAGFGSNGGEEFLSYMNISESLVVRADDAWRKWDGSIAQNLARVQNEDGSWVGHHCITGRTFCTSAALLVLMADRIQFPADALASARCLASAR